MNTNIFTESDTKNFTEKKPVDIEKLKEYRKKYYETHIAKWRDEYNAKDFSKYIDCKLCESSVKKHHIQSHIKTKKHMKLYAEYQLLMNKPEVI